MNFKSLVVVFGAVICGGLCGQSNKNYIQKLDSRNLANTSAYFTRHKRDITINIKIHIDTAVVDTYQKQYGRQTRRKIKFLTKNLVNDVEKLFHSLNTEQKIKFKLLDTKFLKNTTVDMDENGHKYLRSYCDWQVTKKKKWYYSVLLTGLDLFYYDDGGRMVWRSVARSYSNGMCNALFSCTILEFHPQIPILSFQLAHELAHTVGISHDGRPKNNCKSKGYVMGAKFNKKNHPKTWSECSRRDFAKYLMSPKSRCLRSFGGPK